MFFATYLQIFIPFYLVVLAAVTFLHIKESYCSTYVYNQKRINSSKNKLLKTGQSKTFPSTAPDIEVIEVGIASRLEISSLGQKASRPVGGR